MVLRTTAARRALALIGVVAVVLTPAAGEPLPDRDPSEAVFAATLAPSDHPALTKGAVPSVPKPVWTTPFSLPAMLGALVAMVTVMRRRFPDPGRSQGASPGPVLLRAPTRSPPLAPA
jgi:hypothetical protein